MGLALFGGAFNPPHRTHRRIAAAALQELPVSAVHVLPSGEHPHKRGRSVAAAEHRLRLCELAFADLPGVAVVDREVRRAGPSFTVSTLEEYAREHPGRELWFVLGADNVPLLPTWHRHHRLLELARIATFPRLGTALDQALLRDLDLTASERTALLQHVLPVPADGIASDDLRTRLAAGERGLPELLPAVEAYILAHRLYGT